MTKVIMTKRRKELMQEHKATLVDMVYLLEHKLEKAVEEIQFIKNEMLLISESKDVEIEALEASSDAIRNLKAREKEDNKTVNRAMQDIEKQIDKAWEGNITSESFVDTVTKIFTGEYYDKDKKQTSTD